jgi:hypothetical protein
LTGGAAAEARPARAAKHRIATAKAVMRRMMFPQAQSAHSSSDCRLGDCDKAVVETKTPRRFRQGASDFEVLEGSSSASPAIP